MGAKRALLSPRPARRGSRPRWGVLALVVAMVGTLAATVGLAGAVPVHPSPGLGAGRPADPRALSAGGLTTAIRSSQPEICVNDTTQCSAGISDTRITLTVVGQASSWAAWPAVTLVFLLETTPYDGVYDPTAGVPGNDSCAEIQPGSATLCDESNGVPMFAADAGSIAASITAGHPGTRFTFGLASYFATHDEWGDSSGFEYAVNVGTPVPAGEFGAAVQSGFVDTTLGGGTFLTGSDLDENFLHSSSITALYGVLEGEGIAWPSDTHHVVVWIGSTAPRAVGYPENYCPSPSAHVPGNVTCSSEDAANFTAPTCEPSYTFGAGVVSPECEGWTSGPNGSPSDSIAALTTTSPSCVASLGGRCTLDAIDLYDSATDPYSASWPSRVGTSSYVLTDVENVLNAGCDLATATGGSWDGPGFYTCGASPGTLSLSPHGAYDAPNTTNPTLATALAEVGLGSPTSNISAFGDSGPMFTFAAWGNLVVDPDLVPTASCATPQGPLPTCASQPAFVTIGGRQILQWNWSTDPNQNDLAVGDAWTATIQVMAIGGPFSVRVPVDACTTLSCRANGSGLLDGYASSASFVSPGASDAMTESFPLALVVVVPDQGSSGGSSSPPPPPPGGLLPPSPVGAPIVSPVPQPVGVATVTTIASVSLQGVAYGLLAAVLTRVAIRPRQVGMKVATPSGVVRSAFESPHGADAERFVHHE